MDERRDGLRQRDYKEKLRERNGCVNEERAFMQRDGERNRAFLILPPHICPVFLPEMPVSHPPLNEFVL